MGWIWNVKHFWKKIYISNSPSRHHSFLYSQEHLKKNVAALENLTALNRFWVLHNYSSGSWTRCMFSLPYFQKRQRDNKHANTHIYISCANRNWINMFHLPSHWHCARWYLCMCDQCIWLCCMSLCSEVCNDDIILPWPALRGLFSLLCYCCNCPQIRACLRQAWTLGTNYLA